MRTAGIICEYNPFHRGHRFQIEKTRELLGAETAVVCLMSGNYVQRGEPAIFDKWSRAAAAVELGADLVLELPITAAVSGAGYFANGAVAWLDRLGGVDALCFGSECGDLAALRNTAALLHSDRFEEALRQQMKSGVSYARAREEALRTLGGDGEILKTPNNALGVDYLVSLLELESSMEPMTVKRQAEVSATALRERIRAGQWPEDLPRCLRGQPIHTLEQGERAMLAVLKSRTPAEFEAAPFSSEGLWSKVMKACAAENSLEGILFACKSKRYAMSRLKRMLLCLFLGITQEMIDAQAPYLRALAFNDRGRQLLRGMGEKTAIVTGNVPDTPAAKAYFGLECRAADLYGLFAPPGTRERSDREKATPPVYLPEAGKNPKNTLAFPEKP